MELAAIGARFCAILVCAVLFLFWLERRYRLVTHFRSETTSALNLGIARVVIFATLIENVHFFALLRIAALDDSLAARLFGWGTAASHLPRSPAVLLAVYVLFLVSAIAAMSGFRFRASGPVAALTGLYLLTIRQAFGNTDHNHNLVIFAILIALAPAADVLSVDAFRAARRQGNWRSFLQGATSRQSAAPLQAMMLFVSLCYFFPGAWKASRMGLAWFRPSHIGLLLLPNAIGAPSPLTRSATRWMLAHPSTLTLGAVATVVFELGFLYAILSRKTRPFAAISGLLFHLANGILLNILFGSLLPLYVIFFDWAYLLRPLLTKVRASTAAPLAWHEASGLRTQGRLRAATALILTAAMVTGIGHRLAAWPVSCFPTFDWPLDATSEIISLQATSPDGRAFDWAVSENQEITDSFDQKWPKILHTYSLHPTPEATASLARAWFQWNGMKPLGHVTFSSDTFELSQETFTRQWVSRCPIGEADLAPQ